MGIDMDIDVVYGTENGRGSSNGHELDLVHKYREKLDLVDTVINFELRW